MSDIDLFLITASNFLLWKKVKLNQDRAVFEQKGFWNNHGE